MGTVGIKKALVKDIEKLKKYNSNILIELEDQATSFTAYVDKSCLGKNTQKPDETIDTVKWFLIREHIWLKFKQKHTNESNSSFFDKLINELETDDYSILEGNNQLIKRETILKNTPTGNLGVVHILMPYNNYPEFEIDNIYVVVLDKPQVTFALFYLPDKESYIPLISNERTATYGQFLNVTINTHLLPDCREYTKDFKFEIELIDENDEIVATSGLKVIRNKNNYSYNNRVSIDILLDPELRKSHKDENKKREFFLRLKGDESYNQTVVYPQGESDLNTEIYNSKEEKLDWKTFQDNKWVYVYSKNIFVVYDTLSDILSRFEVEKKNMIQYIGDVPYTIKQNEPCAFSTITVSDEERKIEIFNEHKLVNDKIKDSTSQYFDIIAGENKKKITVTAKFKENKDSDWEPIRLADKNLCLKILNSDKEHKTHEDVFKMEYIVGQYIKENDPDFFIKLYKDQLKPIEITSYEDTYKKQRDIKSLANMHNFEKGETYPEGSAYDKFKNLTVAQVQGLTSSDYTIDSATDSITLDLGYKYNKTYNHSILDYLALEQDWLKYGELGNSIANLWVVSYLLKVAKGEDISQTYFVPVSTCRYPNQIAKIRIFPDMKWVLNFNYNIKEPLYYNETPAQLEYYDRRENVFDDLSGNINRAEQESLKKRIASAYHNQKSGFELSVDCEIDGKSPIHLSKEFAEKYRKNLQPIFDTIDFLKKTLGLSEAEKEDELQTKNNLNYKKRKESRKGLNNLPLSFEIIPPSLGIGLGIGYATTEKNIMGWGIEGRIMANPILGANVRLDLLALGSKIKPWGIILDALDISAWAAETLSGGRLEIDYKIEIVFESEINLVGKKLREDPKTKESIYEKYGNIKYNLTDGGTIGDFSVQGIIKGRIEMSMQIKMKKNIKTSKFQGEAGLDIGVKTDSSVRITVPTKLNNEGDLEVDCNFSGVHFEAWFNLSFSLRANIDEKEESKPDISEKILKAIPLNFKIEL